MKYIKNFDYNKYNINYDKCLEFFTELNQNIKPKLINKFNMFEIPKNNTDINNILKEYKKLFYKKSIYFENKLIKVIDEVVKDVKNINETWKKQLKQL